MAIFQDTNTGRRGIDIPLPWRDVMNLTMEKMLNRGYTLKSQKRNSMTFVKHHGPNMLVAAILFLFFFIPGILYLIADARGSTTVISFVCYPVRGTVGPSTRLIIVSNYPPAAWKMINWAESLRAPIAF